jgi:hypothetical protein
MIDSLSLAPPEAPWVEGRPMASQWFRHHLKVKAGEYGLSQLDLQFIIDEKISDSLVESWWQAHRGILYM